jgi:hypothetical protein
MTEDIIPSEVVISKIYEIRGIKVMLDRDLAELYNVKTIRLRQQVKRNANKFPEHFMFQLTEEETINMVSQNVIPSKQHLGGSFPYVFTEHGILQLANVIRSDRATQMSIKIIEVFVKMREMLLTQKELLIEMEEIRKQIAGHDEKIQMIFDYLKQFINDKGKPRKQIGFKQQQESNDL